MRDIPVGCPFPNITCQNEQAITGLVMDSERFKKAIGKLDKVRKGEVDVRKMPEEQVEAFLEEFHLLDPRKFAPEQVVL